LAALVYIALQLNLSSVEDNLSSAYRLGNAITFAQHAVDSDWLVGSGFGSSHFLYPDLEHPDFLYLSNEFRSAMQGEGFRVPVFNLWIRLCVEIGIPATILLLYLMYRAFRSPRVLPQMKILLAASMSFGLSTDSYIYGLFGLALLLAFSLINVPAAAITGPRRRAAAVAQPQPQRPSQEIGR
jgi:hypothetical protein